MHGVYDSRIVKYDNSGDLDSGEQTSRITVQVIGAESIFDTEAIEVREHIEAGGASGFNYQYYENRKDGLYLIGSLGDAVALPKSSAPAALGELLRAALWGVPARSPAGDSIYQEIPPKLALK